MHTTGSRNVVRDRVPELLFLNYMISKPMFMWSPNAQVQAVMLSMVSCIYKNELYVPVILCILMLNKFCPSPSPSPNEGILRPYESRYEDFKPRKAFDISFSQWRPFCLGLNVLTAKPLKFALMMLGTVWWSICRNNANNVHVPCRKCWR